MSPRYEGKPIDLAALAYDCRKVGVQIPD